jgi:hypothetical protein
MGWSRLSSGAARVEEAARPVARADPSQNKASPLRWNRTFDFTEPGFFLPALTKVRTQPQTGSGRVFIV